MFIVKLVKFGYFLPTTLIVIKSIHKSTLIPIDIVFYDEEKSANLFCKSGVELQ